MNFKETNLRIHLQLNFYFFFSLYSVSVAIITLFYFYYQRRIPQYCDMYLEQSKEIKLNWAATKIFDICFRVIFDRYHRNFISGEEDWALGSISNQFRDLPNIS